MGSYYAPSPGHPGFVPMPPGVPRPAPSESERDASERIVPSPMMTGWGGYYGGAAHPADQWMAFGDPGRARGGVNPYASPHPWMTGVGGGPPPLVPAGGMPGPAQPMGRPRERGRRGERDREREAMEGMPYMTPNAFGMMGMPPLAPGGTPMFMPGVMPGYSPMMGHPAMGGAWGTPYAMGRGLDEPESLVAQRAGVGGYGREEGAFVDRWAAGKDYGPVLSARDLRALKVKPELHPILRPPSARADDAYLQWNMLFRENYIHLSTDDARVSWGNRDEPATFPRTDTLIIISPFFPWVHAITTKGRAISTGKLLQELSKFLYTYTANEEYEHAPEHIQRVVYGAWELNRSRGADVPGGNLPKQMIKADFLGNNTMFEGFTQDEKFTAEKLGYSNRGRSDPCVIVLLCGPRPGTDVGGGGAVHSSQPSPNRMARPLSRAG